MIVTKKIALNSFLILLLFVIPLNSKILADNHDVFETIEIIKKDLKTLERAVYSGNSNLSDNNSNLKNNNLSEDALTRHLLKLSEIEKQFQDLTNKFEEINFKIDKLSNRLSKIQADNQLRFQDLENNTVSKNKKNKIKKELPGSDQPQDLGAISSYDTSNTSTTQQTQSIDTTSSIVTEKFEAEEKILPKGSPKEQYEFATSFLKVGDYNTAEVALREFVVSNPDHELAGSAQYWYA